MARFWFHVLGALALLLVGCSSNTPVSDGQQPTGVSGPADYDQPHRDGAPWWDVDVSKISDAVPRVHTGAFKASPYAVLGQTYYPMSDACQYHEIGIASWYGTKFHRQATANGEIYDLYAMTAAHKTLPLPSYVRVTNLENGRSLIVRVNDRGPFYSDRIIDLSFAAAKKLGYADKGTARVEVQGIDPATWSAQQGQPGAFAQTSAASASTAVAPDTVPAQKHLATAPAVPLSAHPPTQGAGIFLQAGAFSNPDAAVLLKDKLTPLVNVPVFIDSVVVNQQNLHRVRLGPVSNTDAALALQNTLRQASINNAALVRP